MFKSSGTLYANYSRINFDTGSLKRGLLLVFYSSDGICTSEQQGYSLYGNICGKHCTKNVLSARDADQEHASWEWSRCGEPSRIPRTRIPFLLPNAAHFGFSLALATTLVQPHHLGTRERERITSIRDWFISKSFDLFSRFKGTAVCINSLCQILVIKSKLAE